MDQTQEKKLWGKNFNSETYKVITGTCIYMYLTTFYCTLIVIVNWSCMQTALVQTDDIYTNTSFIVNS